VKQVDLYKAREAVAAVLFEFWLILNCGQLMKMGKETASEDKREKKRDQRTGEANIIGEQKRYCKNSR